MLEETNFWWQTTHNKEMDGLRAEICLVVADLTNFDIV